MANFNRPLRKDAAGRRAGYTAPAAPAGGQSTAAGSGSARDGKRLRPLPAEAMWTRQSIGDIKVGEICTPRGCSRGLRGEEELDQNPAMLSIVPSRVSGPLRPLSGRVTAAHGRRDPPTPRNIKAGRPLGSGLFAGAKHESGTCLKLQRASNEKHFAAGFPSTRSPSRRSGCWVADVGTHPCAPATAGGGTSQAIPRWRKSIEGLRAISSAFF